MQDSWENRFEWIQSVLQWVSLVVGVVLSLVQLGIEPGPVAASIAVTGYTVALQFIPTRSKRTDLVGGLLAILGVVTSLFAIALTGGLDSAFLLYLTVPIFFASAFHGTVLGVLTTFAAITGLVGVATTTDSSSLSPTLSLMVVIYALLGITFTQAHRVLIDQPRQEPGAAQFHRLESAHQLLADLAGFAGDAELNPITIGRTALRDLAVSVPYASGSIAIIDDHEEIVVATRGHPGPPHGATRFSITSGNDVLGSLLLWPMEGTSVDAFQPDIDRSMKTVGVAFANVVLLQSIAHRAVREERIRLARALHDDIGPSLVSVGLGLDLTIQNAAIDDPTRRHLNSMRGTVGDLVEEVRTTATRLRSAETPSLRDHAHTLAADAPTDGPSIVVDIDEIEQPRSREGGELAAIMTEAVRNALDHADATVIRIEGSIARDRGTFSVRDDGRGIDPNLNVDQRYGLIGMQERAERIGAHIQIESPDDGGTRVTVNWGSR
jgi:signal transduction histidine kinase